MDCVGVVERRVVRKRNMKWECNNAKRAPVEKQRGRSIHKKEYTFIYL